MRDTYTRIDALGPVTLCASCAVEIPNGPGLCPHHALGDTEWAIQNRIMNDLLMRGIQPERLALAERDPGGDGIAMMDGFF